MRVRRTVPILYSEHVVFVSSKNPEALKPCSLLLIAIHEAPPLLPSPAKSLPSGHQRINSRKGLQIKAGGGDVRGQVDKMVTATRENVQHS